MDVKFWTHGHTDGTAGQPPVLYWMKTVMEEENGCGVESERRTRGEWKEGMGEDGGS